MKTSSATRAGAVAGAVGHLLGARDPDGWWRDFWTPAGTSDAWVTAYVATALADAPIDGAREAAEEAWALLECAGFTGTGWGYGPGVPVDADSTCWSLLLANALGRLADERAVRARELVRRHIRLGGVATYADPRPLREFMGLPPSVDLSAWCAPHACVTASAALVPGLRGALRTPLLAAQRQDGSWASYWWFSAAYATAFAVRAFARDGRATVRARIRRAADWVLAAERAGETEDDAFAGALLLDVLETAGLERRAAGGLATELLARQEPSGGWRGAARLRIPPGHEDDPNSLDAWERWLGQTGGGSVEERLRTTFAIFSLDQRGLFTTATALRALLGADRAARPARPAAGAAPRPAASADTVDEFERRGHVSIRGVLAPDEVAELRQGVATALARAANEAGSGRVAIDRDAFRRAEGLWHLDPRVRRYVLDPRLAAHAAALLRCDRVRVFHDQAFFKEPGGGRTPWHQDLAFWPLWGSDVVTLWLPLVGVQPETGGLAFVDGTHRLGPLSDVDRFNERENELDAFVARAGLTVSDARPLEPGAVSAHHGWTLHGAGPNQGSEVREAFAVTYYPDGAHVHSPGPGDAPSRYEGEAALSRARDQARWFAGLEEGARAVTRENPAPPVRPEP